MRDIINHLVNSRISFCPYKSRLIQLSSLWMLFQCWSIIKEIFFDSPFILQSTTDRDRSRPFIGSPPRIRIRNPESSKWFWTKRGFGSLPTHRGITRVFFFSSRNHVNITRMTSDIDGNPSAGQLSSWSSDRSVGVRDRYSDPRPPEGWMRSRGVARA